MGLNNYQQTKIHIFLVLDRYLYFIGATLYEKNIFQVSSAHSNATTIKFYFLVITFTKRSYEQIA